MPITGRKAKDCFDQFANHARELVAATVTQRHPLAAIPAQHRMKLTFRENGPVAVPIETAYGRLYFHLCQSLEAVKEGGQFRLTTCQYWYRLQMASDLNTQAIMRWEYDKTTHRDHHARHHAQLATTVPFGGETLDLNKAHLPTGWVTIEEVIRFLIVDLGMVPPCGGDWSDVVVESERKFYEDFTSKRYQVTPSHSGL